MVVIFPLLSQWISSISSLSSWLLHTVPARAEPGATLAVAAAISIGEGAEFVPGGLRSAALLSGECPGGSGQEVLVPRYDAAAGLSQIGSVYHCLLSLLVCFMFFPLEMDRHLDDMEGIFVICIDLHWFLRYFILIPFDLATSIKTQPKAALRLFCRYLPQHLPGRLDLDEQCILIISTIQ